MLEPAHNDPQAHSRKDVSVVPLPRNVPFASDGDLLEGAPTCEEGSSVCPLVRLLRGALRQVRGVGEGEDDGLPVELGHEGHNLFGEDARLGAHLPDGDERAQTSW